MRAVRGAPRRAPDAAPDAAVQAPVPGAVDGTVVSVARDGARVEHGGRALRLPLRGAPDLAVGDRVRILPLADDLAPLVGRHARKSELARADPATPSRRRVLAANVDLALVVLSVVEPPLKLGLFDRFQVALAAGSIEPRLVVNKVDRLPDDAARAALDARLAPYVEAGVRVHRVSATSGAGLADLGADFAGRTIVAVGHSGVGKSSLLNALDPGGAERVTSAVRASDGKGRHTTTASELRRIAGGTTLIDTPGIRALGLAAEQRAALDDAFPEVAALAAACRFADCRHRAEPDCAVRAAVDAGALDAGRFEAWARLAGD